MAKNKLVAPFLKWVGGKRQLIPDIIKHIPLGYSAYYEPFVGAGALLFHLQPKKAIINDFNEELINVYNVIKNNLPELLEDLKTHINEADYFYEIRSIDRTKDFKNLSPIKKASRVIYLNKTCFNGLYRVNNAGEFNSPFGRYKNPNILNEATLKAVNKYLNNNDIKIFSGDYEDSLKNIKKGSFVYFDPPYDPISVSANFTGYTDRGFDMYDQVRLRNTCDLLHEKEVKFLLSNSATSLIEDLYKDYSIFYIKAKRVINSNGKKRGDVDEVLIKNYE